MNDQIRNPQFDINATIPLCERLREMGDFEGVEIVERMYEALNRLVELAGQMPKGAYGDQIYNAYCRGDLALRVARSAGQ